MAYVVRRRTGRYEIRESLHTANGPRARTLAGFGALTDEVLVAAARRAQRPFDAEAVIGSARRAGAHVRVATSGARRSGDRSRDRFLAASRGMADALRQPPPESARSDPGAALIELLRFADMVRTSQPPRAFEPLAFPLLSRVASRRTGAATTGKS